MVKGFALPKLSLSIQPLIDLKCCKVMVQAIHPGPSRFSSMRRGPLFAFWQPFTQPLQLD